MSSSFFNKVKNFLGFSSDDNLSDSQMMVKLASAVSETPKTVVKSAAAKAIPAKPNRKTTPTSSSTEKVIGTVTSKKKPPVSTKKVTPKATSKVTSKPKTKKS